MTVYLMQHGEAKSEQEDPERDLTDRGALQARMAAERLGRLAPDIHVIWHSGKKRALRTAEIVADNLGIPKRVMEHTGLAPKDDAAPIARKLQKTGRDIMVVGHLPFLSRLASLLLTGSPEPEIVGFRYGAILCLEEQSGRWRVAWMLAPELLD